MTHSSVSPQASFSESLVLLTVVQLAQEVLLVVVHDVRHVLLFLSTCMHSRW